MRVEYLPSYELTVTCREFDSSSSFSLHWDREMDLAEPSSQSGESECAAGVISSVCPSLGGGEEGELVSGFAGCASSVPGKDVWEGVGAVGYR